MITLSYQGEISTSEVQKTASTALENNGLTLQTGENVATGEQTLKISMPGNETVTTDQVENLLTSLNEQYPDNAFAQLSLSNVSAAMGTKFLQKSLVAVVFSLLLILLYIGFRFKKIGGLTGGLMAVLALLNDLMVVFGTFVLLRTPLDGNFIAAMLTILATRSTIRLWSMTASARTAPDGEKDPVRGAGQPLGQPVCPPYHHHYGDHCNGTGCDVRGLQAVRSGQHLYLCLPADDGYAERRVYLALCFHLRLGAVERPQEQKG